MKTFRMTLRLYRLEAKFCRLTVSIVQHLNRLRVASAQFDLKYSFLLSTSRVIAAEGAHPATTRVHCIRGSASSNLNLGLNIAWNCVTYHSGRCGNRASKNWLQRDIKIAICNQNIQTKYWMCARKPKSKSWGFDQLII